MFTGRNPRLHADHRELCIKKTCHPFLVLFNRSGNTSARPSNPHKMIFLAHPKHLTPIESYSSKNRGRGAVSSEAGKCATHTQTRNLNQLIGLLHNLRTPGRCGLRPNQVCWPRFDFRVSIFDLLKTASAKSPAHSSDAPSPHPSAATPTNSLSTRNTTSPAGRHHQSASNADCVSVPRPAKSSSPGPAAKISAQIFEKSKPAATNSKPQQNQSGKDRAAPASLSRGSKTTASRSESLPSGYSAKQNQSSSSPARPYISSAFGTARCSS